MTTAVFRFFLLRLPLALFTLVVTLLITLSHASYAAENAFALNDQEQNYLANKSVITFCADPDWMPYEKISNQQHQGMTADYFELMRQKTGLNLQLMPTTSWAQSIEFAKSRQCDLFSLAMATPERERYMNFTQPLMSFPLVIATTMDTLFVSNIEEVIDKPIGMVKGYAYSELLKQRYPQINLIETTTLKEGLEKVRKGELYGFIDSLATIGYSLQREYIGELKIAGKFVDSWRLSIGVRNDSPELLSILEKALLQITPEEHQAIYNKWISVIYQESTDYTLIIQIVLFAAFIFSLLLYHQWTQNKYLRQLKLAHNEILEKNALLEELSTIDNLTKTYNRHKLNMVLYEQVELFKRYNKPFSIILIDIDLFKSINDQYGHLEGDRILVGVTRAIRQKIRKVDTLGRWGGEEFLIICPSSKLEEATNVAEKIRGTIEQLDFKLLQPTTISLGVSEMQTDDHSDTLLKRADDALYQAKDSGRNCVVIN